MARKTKEDAIATRNGLIDAAEKVFLEKGVSRASLSDIAQAAGATRGAIYWHFKDKVDLFNAMMERACLPLEQGASAFESSTCPDPVQRLRAVMALVLQMVSSDERTRRVFEIALYRVEYVTELAGVRERHIAASDAFTRQLARDFEVAAQKQGIALPMTPMEAAMGLHALFDGLMQNWILNDGGFDLPRVGRVSTDAYLSGLGLALPAESIELRTLR
ncbi:TetR family transcriptional regulator [Acidovorax sp.]|uniref:TetR family transcriptional regulator n=1 Tax=Acidovorax sp. TaxID=1872122 RepID=UPI00391C574E